jgi:hypothetical protein
MPHSFDEELKALLDKARADATPHQQVEAAVAELHRKHGREIPPPIIGTITITEREDSFGGK